MKVLLTGGTGYVGRALREKLVEHGHKVRILVRDADAHKSDAAAGLEYVNGDALDSHACLRAADGCEAIVHLIGIIREFPHEGTTYEAMHTEVTYNVVNAAKGMGIERFVHMSALGARPDSASRYQVTKYESEEIVRKSGLRWTIFRPSVIFDRGNMFVRELAGLVHRSTVPVIDGGTALLQPVSRRDVTDAMARSLRMPETQGRVFEVGGPDRISFAELLNKVASHYGLKPNTLKVSSRFVRPMVRMLQRFKSFPLTVDQMMLLVEDNTCDASAFQTAFGIERLEPFVEQLPDLLQNVEVRAA